MSQSQPVYMLHEYGSPAHYAALSHLLASRNIALVFAEFGVMRQFARGLRRRNGALCLRSLRNGLLLLRLMFWVPRSKIVFGMAPFDSSILLLLLLARHQLFLHSSWPYWDLSKQPHTPWAVLRRAVHGAWRRWLGAHLSHAFFVTRLAQDNNRRSPFPCPRSSVVHHSFDAGHFHAAAAPEPGPRPVRIAFVGRLEVPKGILDFLEVAAREFPFAVEFHIVGHGDQLPAVMAAVAAAPERVFYGGYIGQPALLGDFFRRMDFLLTPSHKTASWEELFGMTLIEAGACGVISYASAHPGPLEILADCPAGGCVAEQQFADAVVLRMSADVARLAQYKDQVAQHFAHYSVDAVAQRWAAVLDDDATRP